MAASEARPRKGGVLSAEREKGRTCRRGYPTLEVANKPGEPPPRTLADPSSSSPEPSSLSRHDVRNVQEPKTRGSLYLIGGAEDKKGPLVVLREFVRLCGGESASIGVLATATSRKIDASDAYVELFRSLGVKDVFAMPIHNRNDAYSPKYIRFMEQLTGAFFTGGNQLVLTSAIGGTTLSQALVRMYERGGVVAGTSAGASAVSRHMIMAGHTGNTPRKGKVSVAAGLGLLKHVVIDQHFSARRRIGRLLTVVAHNPFLLGVGIDEDTAIHVRGDTFEVVGSGTVTVMDGSEISYTNVPFIEKGNVPLCIYNVRTHVLIAGCRYDITRRVPLNEPPVKE